MLEPKIVYGLDDNIKDSSSGGSGWSALMQSAIEEDTRPLDIYDAPFCSINFISESADNILQTCGILGHSNSGLSKSNTQSQNRLKKRKASIFSQSPWRKVVLQGSELCHSISNSEQEWALATNTQCEKVDPKESIPCTKRRLVLSTHLMQQLLQPAPTFVLSGAFNYEIMLYFVSRITLADACSLKCHSSKSTNLQTSKIASDQDQHYSSLVKAFMEKRHKLESDFQRLEMTSSIIDIVFEIQDLERLYVLNHLAEFHSRTKTTTRSVPRRYVVGQRMRMPNNLPDPLQCLPL